MTKYEYSSLTKYGTIGDDDFIAEMNLLGKDGWELVVVTTESETYNPTAYFKRKL